MTGAGGLGAVLTGALLGLGSWWRVPCVIALVAGLVLWANPPRPRRLERLLLGGSTPALMSAATIGIAWPLWGASHAAAGSSHASILGAMLPVAVTGGLLFALARAVIREGIAHWAALLAWVGWIDLVVLRMVPSMPSGPAMVNSALWLAGWWALLRWRDRRHRLWLCVLAACVVGGAVLRPLATLAYVIPLGLAAMIVSRHRARHHLEHAATAGTVLGGLILPPRIPIAGHWLPVLSAGRSGAMLLDMPATVVTYAAAFAEALFGDWRDGLLPFSLIGIALMPIELAWAAASSALLLILSALYGHEAAAADALEAQPTAIALAAFGICAALALVGRQWVTRQPDEAALDAASRFVGWCVSGLVLVVATCVAATMR